MKSARSATRSGSARRKQKSGDGFDGPPQPVFARTITFQERGRHGHKPLSAQSSLNTVTSSSRDDDDSDGTLSQKSFQSHFNGTEELYFAFRGKMSELIDSYSYYIREKGESWKALVTWDGSDAPSTKQKSSLVFSIEESSSVIKIVSKDVPEWRANIKVRTNISQSSKKFLQFSDSTIKKQPIVYGFGFDSENDAKHCLEVITKMKNKLDDIRTKRLIEKQKKKSLANERLDAANQENREPNAERGVRKVKHETQTAVGVVKREEVMHEPSVKTKSEILNATAPAIIPHEIKERDLYPELTPNQHDITNHPPSFNTSTVSTNTSLREDLISNASKDKIQISLFQQHQDQENNHQAQLWQRENNELRKQLDAKIANIEDLTNQNNEQIERIRQLEQEKNQVQKMMTDQAILTRQFEDQIKGLKEKEDLLKKEQEKIRGLELRVQVLQKVQDERVPELEQKVIERDAQNERYLNLMQTFHEKLGVELNNLLQRRRQQVRRIPQPVPPAATVRSVPANHPISIVEDKHSSKRPKPKSILTRRNSMKQPSVQATIAEFEDSYEKDAEKEEEEDIPIIDLGMMNSAESSTFAESDMSISHMSSPIDDVLNKNMNEIWKPNKFDLSRRHSIQQHTAPYNQVQTLTRTFSARTSRDAPTFPNIIPPAGFDGQHPSSPGISQVSVTQYNFSTQDNGFVPGQQNSRAANYLKSISDT